MQTDAQLERILNRIACRSSNFLDVEALRDHLNAQAAAIAERDQTIARLRAEVETHDAALQARDAERNGWHTIQVRRVPVIGTVTGSDARVVFYEAVETDGEAA